MEITPGGLIWFNVGFRCRRSLPAASCSATGFARASTPIPVPLADFHPATAG